MRMGENVVIGCDTADMDDETIRTVYAGETSLIIKEMTVDAGRAMKMNDVRS